MFRLQRIGYFKFTLEREKKSICMDTSSGLIATNLWTFFAASILPSLELALNYAYSKREWDSTRKEMKRNKEIEQLEKKS